MKKILLYSALLFMLAGNSGGQEFKRLTLNDVIKLAESQSPQALIARHRFRASYWSFKSYQAQLRPTLSLRGTAPAYSNGFDRVYDSNTDQYKFVEKKTINNSATMSLSQSIGWTGTTISVQSDLNHLYDFQKDVTQYNVTPVSITLRQPIKQYNSLRWQMKIEPLKYETAKQTYLGNIEDVHLDAVRNFFSLALAQINKQIAVMNLSNSDTLYRIAAGRYQLGTISEDELLQMQLSYLNAETASKEADMNLRDREIRLRSFLGYNENVRLELIIPAEIPDLQVDSKEVLDLAMKNNPDILSQQLNLLNAQSSVAQARANKGLNASLNASLGLTQKGGEFLEAIKNPNQMQQINLGFMMPILDWGRGRGSYRMAQSSQELTNIQVQQAIIDFQQNLALDVEQFNLQKSQVAIAAKSDTVARRMFDVTKQRFLIGKIAILELNNADTRKDQNRRAYIQALQNYWTYFYNMRNLTLYDFINRKPVEADYNTVISTTN